jgi:hypothetical protein
MISELEKAIAEVNKLQDENRSLRNTLHQAEYAINHMCQNTRAKVGYSNGIIKDAIAAIRIALRESRE